jgi:hypothetical protein
MHKNLAGNGVFEATKYSGQQYLSWVNDCRYF